MKTIFFYILTVIFVPVYLTLLCSLVSTGIKLLFLGRFISLNQLLGIYLLSLFMTIVVLITDFLEDRK
jgi:hypothetical protein